MFTLQALLRGYFENTEATIHSDIGLRARRHNSERNELDERRKRLILTGSYVPTDPNRDYQINESMYE